MVRTFSASSPRSSGQKARYAVRLRQVEIDIFRNIVLAVVAVVPVAATFTG